MQRSTVLFLPVVLALLVEATAFAQTFDAQFVVMLNDGANYDVKMQLKANGSTFAMGTSNLIFSFDAAALSAPILQTAHNFSGGAYQTMLLSGSVNSRSVNIELNVSGAGTAVATDYMDVATIRFTVTDKAGGSHLIWNRGATVIYKDDESTVVPAGELKDLNTAPLPIQLTGFSGSTLGSGLVRLEWATKSEVNNFGFYVQRRWDSEEAFVDIDHAFVPGHGTTNIPQHYYYTDSLGSIGKYEYRLKQVDLDGTVHYQLPVRVELNKSLLAEEMPSGFSISQNYPNPFNPTTTISYGLPQKCEVELTVFNTIGQRVATLVRGQQEAGFHEVKFDGSALASGVYFYRMHAGKFVQTKKLLLLK